MSAPIIPTDCCNPCPTPSQVPGPRGSAGTNGANGNNGVNAFTITNAAYSQPDVDDSVTISVVSSEWCALGENIFITNGGTYQITGIPDMGSITITNLGYTGNAAPTTIISSNSQVTPSGIIGPAGSAGANSLNLISPTTTKGDLIVDNGSNDPLASDVRLGVGTNGQILAADSAQPTGMKWASVIPSSPNQYGVPVFATSSGSPILLADSTFLITPNSIHWADGDSRGTNAVDLQISRSSSGLVASGTASTIGGGTDNQVVSIGGTIIGGGSNQVNGDYGVAGGSSNYVGGSQGTAFGSSNSVNGEAALTLGQQNIANGLASFAIGSGCTAAVDYSSATGKSALAYLYGQRAHSAGNLVILGDAQVSTLILRGTTVDATPTDLLLDGPGGSAFPVQAATGAWMIKGTAIACRTDGAATMGSCKGFTLDGMLSTVNGSLLLNNSSSGSVSASTVGTANGTITAAITMKVASDVFSIVVTGGAMDIKWVVRLELVETIFA